MSTWQLQQDAAVNGNAAVPPKPSPESASLLHRLAGPSVTKAGLAKDQTDINRIIAEVSKGSKFYENEKRKDQDLTERIFKIIATRDDALKAANIGSIEIEIDRMLQDIESQRDLSQYIVHVDMDAFFANVELKLNPNLKGKPFGVGSIKGVLTTASYEARKFGVRSGMAGFVAKKLCPELIFVPMSFSKYNEMSHKIMHIFKSYDPNMLVAGCDEGYLNITTYCSSHGLEPEVCVERMRAEVEAETGLTASAGIAPTRMLAKICSDKNKPNGVFHLKFDRETILSFVQVLPIRKLPGVGRVNERLLESLGVKTVKDIFTQRVSIYLLDKYCGLDFLLRAYLGVTSNFVQPLSRSERKSIGAERTFNPIREQEKILEKLREVAAELEDDMERTGWTGKTIVLKYKLDTYEVHSRTKALGRWISKKEDLYSVGYELLKDRLPLKLRLIGLRITKLKDLRTPQNEGIEKFFGRADLSFGKKRLIEEVDLTKEQYEDDDEVMPSQLELEHRTSQGVVSEEITEQDQASEIDLENAEAPITRLLHSVSPVKRAKSRTITITKRSLQNEIEAQACPICEKTLATNNAGLNEHIDFCLSKGAIMRATQAATSKAIRSSPAKTANHS